MGRYIKNIVDKSLILIYRYCISTDQHWPTLDGTEGNLSPHHPPLKHLGEYTSRGKPKIPHADRIAYEKREAL